MDVKRLPFLPAQAWLLKVADRVQLWCGGNVETSELAFFEGAWAAGFGPFKFGNCENVFGSGAYHTSAGWILVPPSHTLEAIYALRLPNNQWLVSNSLGFVRSQCHFDFCGSYLQLTRAFVGIVNGIDNSPQGVPVTAGDLYILHHHNALLTPNGLQVTPKPTPPSFAKYTDYYDFLIRTVEAVTHNAADYRRRKTFRLLATISSGYDSPACATIARANGCTDAITFVNARGDEEDDGSLIAKQIGLKCHKVTRPATMVGRPEAAADFLAAGTHGEDLVYDVLRGQLTGRIFVTGFHGDKVWDLHGNANSVLKRGDISGTSLTEFRLQEGFLHLPLPFVGAQSHADILRISQSSEMMPFRIGGQYDRPIPRRIAEDGGATRSAFGQAKKAVSLLLFSDQRLIKDDLRSQFKQKPLKYYASILSFQSRMFAHRLSQRIPWWKFPKPIGIGLKKFVVIVQNAATLAQGWTILEHSHPINIFLFYWALDKVQERYSRATGSCIHNCPVE